jgi:hypothetical protein
MIFDGVQDFNPETTININFSKKQQTTSIVVVHIITQAMKKALPSMYRSLKSWGLATSLANLRVKYFDDWYPIPGGVGFINYYAGVDNNHYSHIVLLKNIIDALHNLIQSIVCVYKRDELATLTITNHPFTSLSFFKTDTHLGQIYKTNDYVNYDTDLVVIEHTLNIPNNTNQGAFVDADGSVWYEKTLFDFFSELVEGNICKTVIDNNGIIYLRTLEGKGGSYSINDTNIIKDNVEIVIGGSSYKEFKNNLEGVGDLGIEEFGYQNTQRNNDKSIEIKSLLHNHFCLQEFMYANESNNVCETVHWSPSPFGLYYWDSGLKSYVLVSDICNISVGGFISPVTADLSTAYSVHLHMVDKTNLPNAFNNLVAFCNERYKVSGLGYLACKALNEIFGNPYTSKITLNLNSDIANWLTLGEYYVINLNSMTDSTYLQPPLRSSNYLVRVSQDLIKDETIATFWTRGT